MPPVAPKVTGMHTREWFWTTRPMERRPKRTGPPRVWRLAVASPVDQNSAGPPDGVSLGTLTIDNTDHSQAGDHDRLACRRDPKEVPFVSASRSGPRTDVTVFGHLIFNGNPQIGESSPKHGHNLCGSIGRIDRSICLECLPMPKKASLLAKRSISASARASRVRLA